MVNTREEEYLQQTYGELVLAQEQLVNLLTHAKEDGLSALSEMSGDISLNFDSVLDNLDTFSMIEMKNREIDQMNIKVQSADKQLQKVERLLENPYFGKVSVDFLDEEPDEDFYIGMHNFANEEGENRIYDWRSPIAELFYNNMIGPSSYTANQLAIQVEILNRRQFLIEKNRLLRFFDTSIAIQDDVLLAALEQNSSSQMQDITSTIQQEQNAIIRDSGKHSILVNGVAGSGKTSTIMQRIAYLLYSLRQEITSEDILILSPNNKFIQYISDVLPSLGENNPRNQTILQFTQQYVEGNIEDESAYFARISSEEVDGQTANLRSKELIDFLEKASQTIQLDKLPLKAITQKGKVVISEKLLDEFYQKTPKGAALIDRVQATKRLLTEYWDNRLLRQAKNKETQNQILSLSEEQQKKYFGHLIEDDSPSSVAEYGYKLLKRTYRKVTKAIKAIDWLDKEGLFLTLYNEFTKEDYHFTSPTEYTLDEAIIMLYIQHCFIGKLELPKTRFVLVDEVQDYTPAQMQLLIELFSGSQFTLVGDENQAIFNSAISFTTIIETFEEHSKEISQYNLLNSYRSSGAITKLFKKLSLQSTQQMEIVPVRPKGEDPRFYAIADKTDLKKTILELIAMRGEKLTIVTKTLEEATELSDWFSAEITNKKLEVYPISLSKGLEFDHVFLYNVSKNHYQSTRDQRILYTAISRAMQTLVIGYQQDLSAFLA
ncbi:ATP-dependent DNA helicase IV [Enterococcus sp. JM4C]|uniref:HelD family protein n=1 Tax=Candidatus Enterococcus huntleyi TaxID=1857217 RepID=UPI00137B74A9|nr:UvrD-helicase domain-containing protein [Enterococcus sp. JM4C]KAF1299591.1 ATP-dependent DNA helicase IV [Enterococcus sp. JM4C]